MLAHPETRVLAAQNLAEYAAKQGKLEQAWGYIQETTDSGDTQSLRTLLSIAAKSGKWVEADSSLASYRASGLISRSEYRRLHGLLKLLQAEELLKRGDSASALPLSAHAFKLLPDFTPSGAVYAQVLLAQKQSDHAFKILKKAWKYGPHPMLAEVFRELTAGETPEQGFKHAKKIAALSPEDKESRLLLAEAAVRSKHWYVARVELNALLAVDVSARACKLMADVEQGEYNDYDASSSWRIKAGEAPREATWVCRECGNVGDIYWHVHCGHCNAFDSLLWLMPRTTGTDVAI